MNKFLKGVLAMADEQENQDPTEELSKEDLEKIQGGTLNFGDIKGESTDKDHKDWIEILSYDHKITPTGK
jgi:bacteriocin-like protein